jgi:hypothetical protein
MHNIKHYKEKQNIISKNTTKHRLKKNKKNKIHMIPTTLQRENLLVD